jgi:predicted Zn-dependent protease
MKPTLAGTTLTLGLLLLVSGCQQVPITHRSSLNLVNHEDMVRVSAREFEQMKRRPGLVRSRELEDQLQRVGARLAPVVFWDVPDADWEFIVLNQPKVINALSAAGGKIAVASGLFRIVENDDQLAWIVAHEMGHLAARHSDERVSRELIAKGGAFATAIGLGLSGNGAVAQSGYQTVSLSATVLNLSFDREQELEADRMGLVYMARAGYNPEQGVRVFDRLAETKTADGSPQPGGIFSTHPDYPERILQLIDHLPEAMEIYRHPPAAKKPVIIK